MDPSPQHFVIAGPAISPLLLAARQWILLAGSIHPALPFGRGPKRVECRTWRALRPQSRLSLRVSLRQTPPWPQFPECAAPVLRRRRSTPPLRPAHRDANSLALCPRDLLVPRI